MRPPVVLLLLLPFVYAQAAAGEFPPPRSQGVLEGDAQVDAGEATTTSDISPAAQADGGNRTGCSAYSDGTDKNPTEINYIEYENPENTSTDTDKFMECDYTNATDTHDTNEQEAKYHDTESGQEDNDADQIIEHDCTNTTDDAHGVNEKENQYDHTDGIQKNEDADENNHIEHVLHAEYFYLRKCCKKGEYMVNLTCEQKPGVKVEERDNDYFDPPINEPSAYWIPEILRFRNITVAYKFLDRTYTIIQFLEATKENINTFLGVKTIKRLLVKADLRGRLHPLLIKNHLSCFEMTDNKSRPLVLVTQWKTFALRKCCRKSERWDLENNKCKAINVNQSDNTEKEVVDIEKDPLSAIWLPRSLQKNIIEVHYNSLPDDGWNVIIDADEQPWRYGHLDNDFKIELRDSSGIKRITESFCFDSSYGEPEKHILAARLVQIYKCCKNGEELNRRLDDCVPKPGFKVDNNSTGVIDLAKSNYWFPKQNISKKMGVKYSVFIPHIRIDHAFRTDTIKWKFVSSKKGEPAVLTFIPSHLTNDSFTVYTEHFCLDSVSTGLFAPHVITIWLEKDRISRFVKCCPRSEVLTEVGICVQHDREDWSPYTSIISSQLKNDSLYGTEISKHPSCVFSFVHVEQDPDRFYAALSSRLPTEVFSWMYFCADLLRNSEGSEQETLAYCEVPTNAWLYKRVRPLQVVAAALLGAAVVVAVARGQTRRSVHGRALACHAACLMASNALQAAWFFSHQLFDECSNFAYAIYFFLVSSNMWLNVISINIARGFSLQQGGRSGRITERSSWKRLVVYSFYAWGTSLALTATSMYMDINRNYVDGEKPTFAETRTCFSEIGYLSDGYTDFKLGTFFYFYLPTGILIVLNAICLLVTMCKIKNLSSGSSLINTSRTLNYGLLYVKLLLTAGVAELAVEASAWATRKNRLVINDFPIPFFVEESSYRLIIILTFLDVVRAAAVLWLCVGRWPKTMRWLRQCTSALSRLLHCPPRGPDTTLPFSSPLNASNIPETATTHL